MRSIVTAITFLALLVAPAVAQAGPVRKVLGLAIRAATAPVKLVGAARANRQEARQSRRAARGCN